MFELVEYMYSWNLHNSHKAPYTNLGDTEAALTFQEHSLYMIFFMVDFQYWAKYPLAHKIFFIIFAWPAVGK